MTATRPGNLIPTLSDYPQDTADYERQAHVRTREQPPSRRYLLRTMQLRLPRTLHRRRRPAERRVIITDDFGQKIEMSLDQLDVLVTDIKTGTLDGLLTKTGA